MCRLLYVACFTCILSLTVTKVITTDNKIKHCIKGIISNGFVFSCIVYVLQKRLLLLLARYKQMLRSLNKMAILFTYIRVLSVFVPETFVLCELDCVVFVCFHCFFSLI